MNEFTISKGLNKALIDNTDRLLDPFLQIKTRSVLFCLSTVRKLCNVARLSVRTFGRFSLFKAKLQVGKLQPIESGPLRTGGLYPEQAYTFFT